MDRFITKATKKTAAYYDANTGTLYTEQEMKAAYKAYMDTLEPEERTEYNSFIWDAIHSGDLYHWKEIYISYVEDGQPKDITVFGYDPEIELERFEDEHPGAKIYSFITRSNGGNRNA